MSRVLRGIAAGAAGTTALNAVTYLDIYGVVRPRLGRTSGSAARECAAVL